MARTVDARREQSLAGFPFLQRLLSPFSHFRARRTRARPRLLQKKTTLGFGHASRIYPTCDLKYRTRVYPSSGGGCWLSKTRRLRSRPLFRERIRTDLEVHGHGLHALATFLQPRRAVAARGPQAAALPAGVRIVDAAVESLGVEALGI